MSGDVGHGSTGTSPDAAPWPFRESIKVRYAEVDAQKVVFNAHYLTYCDVVSASWAEAGIGWTGVEDAVDWMLVKATIEWQSSARYGDQVDIDCGVTRWGNKSFDARYRGTVEGRPVFTADITYVTVDPVSGATVPVPDKMRSGFKMAPS